MRIYKNIILTIAILTFCLFLSGCGGGSKAADKEQKCTISIRCDTILDNMDRLKKEKLAYVPDSGVILQETEVRFTEGETAHDLLKKVCKDNNILMESTYSPLYKSSYVEGIAQLYEFDCGELSGWMYKVNGDFPDYGSSSYELKADDKVEFLYTCEQGKDISADVEGM